jgi:energy-coupling factor transport system permease protein
VIYKRRRSPLHSARAVAGALWCLALVTVALSAGHPLVIGTVVAAAMIAAALARVGRCVALSVALSVPFGIVIVFMNALTSRSGLTVIWHFGGGWDVTLEAVVQGAVYALVAVALFAVARLYSAAVDPDDLLRAFRRLSFSSALTAALATRMVPVLARDARRLTDAGRARAGEGPSRLSIVRAVAAGSMDRAVDVAATLEVRGYGAGRRAPALRRAWSRHDIAFTASAAGLFVLAVLVDRLAPFEAYPRVVADLGASELLAAALVLLVALLPFADRRGV